MDITRREFLGHSKSLLTAAALASLGPSLRLWASPERKPIPHFFLLMKTYGGMDVTLGLDPWVMPEGADDKDMFIEYRPDEIVRVGELAFGPSAVPLVPFASECSIVNGVMMRRDAGHDVIHQYMLTGRGDGKAATLPVELALAHETHPFGVLSNLNLYTAGKPVNISTTGDISAESNQAELIQWIEDRVKYLASEQGTPFEEAEKQVVAGKESAVEIQKALAKVLQEHGKVEDRHVVAATFAAQGAQFAEMFLPIPPLELDTHSDHAGNHVKTQQSAWQAVADIFKLFQSVPYGQSSLFEHTSFMVVSEFSRTPFLNAAKGKDHNAFTNSVLFAGKGIQKGRVVGKSRLITRKQTGTYADHIAWPFNYTTGTLAEGPEGASFIYPENLIRTVGEIFGSPETFHPVPATVPIVPGVAKTT